MHSVLESPPPKTAGSKKAPDPDSQFVLARLRKLSQNPLPRSVAMAKRCMDIGISAMALLALSPLFIALPILIKLDSKGPAYFRQQRVGRVTANASEFFTILKFRTLYEDASPRLDNELSPAAHKVTRIGRFLRRTKLDEIPQFWHVLRGDMSLVGPRPYIPDHYRESYDQRIDLWHRTLFLKPGLTSRAQIAVPVIQRQADYAKRLNHESQYRKRVRQKPPCAAICEDIRVMIATIRYIGRNL